MADETLDAQTEVTSIEVDDLFHIYELISSAPDVYTSKQGKFSSIMNSIREATVSVKGFLSPTDKTKLDGIASGAQVNPAQVSGGEITAGTETALRSVSPLNVKTFVTTHETGDANPATVTQGDAQAGTSAVNKLWPPLRVKDAIFALAKAVLSFAITDDTTTITTGIGLVTYRAPFAMTVTAVRASLKTASTSGLVTIDINKNGTTILSTKLTIDANEKTSVTATTAAVISVSAFADDDEITVDIDAAGTGAVGLKVSLIGTQT